MSERGAESIAKLSEEEKDLQLARLFIGGWHYEAVKNNEEIVGTKITYLVKADAGGNIPSAL